MNRPEKEGPAPDAPGNGPDTEDSHRNVTDGEAGKQLALGLFREHRKEKLADIAGARPAEGPPRPDGRGWDDAAEAPSRPDRPGVTTGAGPLFPEMRPPYREPGDARLGRAGRRRR